MNHGSLFSGIGGFDLVAQWMGWKNVFHCEWEEFSRKVLKHHFPNSISYGDITKTDFTIHRGQIDILSGGFPCQPYSQAGKRLGTEDDRHLWPEMLRAIREIQPKWVVGENVRGLINWNDGMVFDQVQTDLEAAGYQVQPFLLPACGVNAPHRRDRIWFVAHSNVSNDGRTARKNEGKGGEERVSERNEVREFIKSSQVFRPTPDTDSKRSERRTKSRDIIESRKNAIEQPTGLHIIPQWEKFPTKPPVFSGNDGLSDRLDGITFSKWRNQSIKAYGNAIVPQVVYQIFKAIEAYNLQE